MARIQRSTRRGKKWMVKKNNKTIHAGDSNYSIGVGTKRGNNYCTRSFGIKGKTGSMTANGLARKMWGCVGKRSVKSRAGKIGGRY